MKILSQDLMAVSEELLFELKPKEEKLPHSEVQYSAFTPLEVQCKDDEPEPAVSFKWTDPIPTAGDITGEQPPESTRDLPRGTTAVEAGRKRKKRLENLN